MALIFNEAMRKRIEAERERARKGLAIRIAVKLVQRVQPEPKPDLSPCPVPIRRSHSKSAGLSDLGELSVTLGAGATCWVCRGSASVTLKGKAAPCPACRRDQFYVGLGEPSTALVVGGAK